MHAIYSLSLVRRSAIAAALGLFVFSDMALPQEGAAIPDPPNGLVAQELDALRVGPLDLAGKYGNDYVMGYFPESARMANMSGKVLVDVQVDKDGRVRQTKVVEETPKGWQFGRAALNCIKKIRFKNPYGRAVVFVYPVEWYVPRR